MTTFQCQVVITLRVMILYAFLRQFRISTHILPTLPLSEQGEQIAVRRAPVTVLAV